MKIFHFSLIAAILIASTFAISSSCKKKKKFCESGSTCRSVLEAKDFFLFKEGSWWVYEEETTHERDSQYVYQSSNTTGYYFFTGIHSSLDEYNYRFWPIYADGAIETCSETEPVSGRCLYIKRDKGKIGDFIGEGNYFVFNYSLENYFYSTNINFPNNKVTFESISMQLSQGNVVWDKVVKTHELCELQENNQATNHYYKKNIGLVRKELMDSNQVWNLVNYHIVQ